jgi:DNA-binding transcriptional regulator YiaG
MNKITMTIEFSEKELQAVFENLQGVEIVDVRKMQKIMQSKKFAQALAHDVKEAYIQIWREKPEWEVLEQLGLTVAMQDTTQYS